MDVPNESCKFIIVFNGGKVSFKSKSTGKFLTALGARGTCKATKSAITKDELFHMEDSFPQLKFTSANGKKLSIKAGIELAATQAETTDTEIFQVSRLFSFSRLACSLSLSLLSRSLSLSLSPSLYLTLL